MKKKDREQEEILDMLRWDLEAHERLLERIEKAQQQYKPSEASPAVPQMEQRLHRSRRMLAFAESGQAVKVHRGG
jgi:hypothetical protein